MKNILFRVVTCDLQRATLWTVLVVVGLAVSSEAAIACCRNYEEFADACRADGGIPSQNPLTCSPAASAPSSSAPTRDYEAERRQQEAAAATAAAAAERQRQAEEQQRKEAAERQAAFIRSRDEAVNTLKGSSGGGDAMSQLKGLSGADNSGLKGSGFDNGVQLKSAPDALKGSAATPRHAKPVSPPPSGDPMVVDARNVPSGLPKALDDAIAGSYSSAPLGVSDRVRKGFQAVMLRDWKVAKAWFQDALNRDPNNAGLKRLVALSDSSQQPDKQHATVGAHNEPAGLGGGPDAKAAGAPAKRTKPASASTTKTQLQLPDPNDIYLMFPGLKKMEDKEALDYLFGLDPYPASSKSGKTK